MRVAPATPDGREFIAASASSRQKLLKKANDALSEARNVGAPT